jgi:serine/threonine-protein kinase HipA
MFRDEATYTDIAECIRMYSSEPTVDLHELWRLSPAYDLNPVPLVEKARELATWISEEGTDADLDIARRAAPFFALKGDQAEAITSEVSDVLKGWQNTARQLGMSAADIAVYATAIQCVAE